MRHVVLFVAFALLASQGHAQAGRWVLDGWPHERHGFFAGRTEVVADGARLKITEWPENTEDAASSLVTYFMGQTVVKVFPWQGERVGLVFESDTPLPRAERNSEGQLVLPPPFPPRTGQEGMVPCGDGCLYHVRTASFEPLDEGVFAPGKAMADAFVVPDSVSLFSKDEFVARYRMAPPELTPFSGKR